MRPSWVLLFVFLLFSSCQPVSLADLRYEGEAQTRKLASELRAIENRGDLQRALPRLKKRFDRIAAVLIAARAFSSQERGEPSFASEELFAELARLYEMPGGRELIESAQMEAIHRLKH